MLSYIFINSFVLKTKQKKNYSKYANQAEFLNQESL